MKGVPIWPGIAATLFMAGLWAMIWSGDGPRKSCKAQCGDYPMKVVQGHCLCMDTDGIYKPAVGSLQGHTRQAPSPRL